MSDRTIAYIDGESHFIRAQAAWREIHGPAATLERLRHVGEADCSHILLIPEAKVFWTRRLQPGVQRSVYFTSASGDAEAKYNVELKVRNFDLEPSVCDEKRDLMNRRANKLVNEAIIEKAKGVDISLAVRMVEDAHRLRFDAFHVYTSDVDFLPAIQCAMALGVHVCVHGFKSGLSKYSPLLTTPDQFIDLEDLLRNDCELAPSDSTPPNGNGTD